MSSVRTTLILISITVFLVATTTGRPVLAWGVDFHYGLVKWLALNAGFTNEGAEIIAAASESFDESTVTDAVGITIITVCRDKDAAGQIQKLHFPAGPLLPMLPRDRPVNPGVYGTSNSANDDVRSEIKSFEGDHYPDKKLFQFGQALHPLADSWSHRGESDTNWFCPDNLIWAHPEKRGGWWTHNADLTYHYPEDAVAAAESIYKFVKEFKMAFEDAYNVAEVKKYIRLGVAPTDENVVRDSIKEFSKLKYAYRRGKESKFEWYKDEKIWSSFDTYKCFLRRTSLIGSVYAPCVPHRSHADPDFDFYFGIKQDERPSIKGKVPDKVIAFFNQFLSTWILGTDLKKNIASLIPSIDVNRLTARLAEGNADFKNFVGEPGWVIAVFGMWLAEDHGIINSMGHGMPGSEGYSSLTELDFHRLRTPKNLSQAIVALNGEGPYLITRRRLPNSDRNEYAVAFKFRHLPNDTVALIAGQSEGELKVEGVIWHIH